MLKSATRVMQILELVGRSKDGLKHLDIAKTLNIPKGSLSLLLSDLLGSEFLTIGEDDKRYRVGHKIIVLAGRYLADLDIIKASQPFIRSVIAATNESCGLAMIMGGKAMILWREETLEPLKWDFKKGIISIPVPVFNNMRRVVASLGTPVPSQRFSSEKEGVIGEALWEAAGLLSRELGYF